MRIAFLLFKNNTDNKKQVVDESSKILFLPSQLQLRRASKAVVQPSRWGLPTH